MGLIRINIFRHVTCLGNALNNKDSNFPVVVVVKDAVDGKCVFDMRVVTLL